MKLCLILIGLLCFCLENTVGDDANDVIVETKNGKIRGEKLETLLSERSYFSFKGIPYAKPPLGNLRFKPPVPIEDWDGIKNATKHQNFCVQLSQFDDDDEEDDDDDDNEDKHEEGKSFTQGEEDCLYLNVYSPNLSENADLPVMVYIHGGGFFEGKGDSDEYGPDFLIERDVVVVTLNYRLGPLGFLSLEGTHIKGNMGLKDQQLALKWVYDNIEEFGGDKDLITVFGNSAGAASTHYQVLNPVSSKFIKRAILTSGSVLNSWAVKDLDLELLIMRNLAIVTPDVQDRESFMQYLHEADGHTIIATMPTHHGPNLIDVTFTPVIEEKDDPKAFLTEEPLTVLNQTSFNNIDTMFGFASHESYMFIKEDVEDAIFLKGMDKSFEVPFPTREFDFITGKKKDKAMEDIRKHYFEDKKINSKTSLLYVDLTSDVYFGYGVYKSVKYHAKNSDGKTYHFRFAVDAGLNMMKTKKKITKDITTHADEICYIFRCQMFDGVYKNMTEDSVQRMVIDRVTSFYVNFAKYGSPIPNNYEEWPPVTDSGEYYVNVKNDGIFVSMNPHKKDFPFWTQLLEKYKNPKKHQEQKENGKDEL